MYMCDVCVVGVCVYVCMYVVCGGGWCVRGWFMWVSEDSFVELVLFFQLYMDSKN